MTNQTSQSVTIDLVEVLKTSLIANRAARQRRINIGYVRLLSAIVAK
jgi:hypothetical protein